jgi:preprotein translocase subunit SecD
MEINSYNYSNSYIQNQHTFIQQKINENQEIKKVEEIKKSNETNTQNSKDFQKYLEEYYKQEKIKSEFIKEQQETIKKQIELNQYPPPAYQKKLIDRLYFNFKLNEKYNLF